MLYSRIYILRGKVKLWLGCGDRPGGEDGTGEVGGREAALLPHSRLVMGLVTVGNPSTLCQSTY